MKNKLTILALFVSSFVFGQDMSDFSGLKSDGLVPEDFTTLTSDKYKADLESNTDESLDKNFFLSTRFFIDELLLSGKMLFNEPISDYLSKVARYTLRREKKLFNELRFYVLKSNAVNAFSTDQGIIVFTTGLMAELQNEAQLAYIIAHEVSHYTEHHVREGYVEKQSFKKGHGKYQRLGYESRISELSVYEKDNELEADKKGIEMYLSSEYAIDEIFSSFEMLLYSYLPFDEVKFDSNYFNTEIMQIPGVMFPDTINAITREEDYDDENSSHPNIKKRMDAAFDFVDGKSSQGNLKFKISELDFNKVRNMARFESLNISLANREYGKALYVVYLLEKEFPNNRFLELSKLKALYGLTKYKNANRYREVTLKPKKVEGESYVLHAFLRELSKAQLNVIAYRCANDLLQKYPGDKIFQEYEKDLKEELAFKSGIRAADFKSKPYEEYIASIEEEVMEFDIQDSIARVDASTDLSKYEKIRLKKKLRALETDMDQPVSEVENEFYLYALHDLVKNEGLVEELETIKANLEQEEEDAKLVSDVKEKKIKSGEGSIKKVVIVDPVYEGFSVGNKRKFTQSEDRKIQVSEGYSKSYPKLNLETQLLDSKFLSKESVKEYNNLGLIFQWLSETLEHDDIDMICSTRDKMKEVRKYYGTDHFLFTGIYGYKERHEFTGTHLYGIMFIYTAPIAIIDLLVIHNYFEMVAFSVNAESDKVEFVEVNDVNLRGTNRILQAYIYDVLYQISTIK